MEAVDCRAVRDGEMTVRSLDSGGLGPAAKELIRRDYGPVEGAQGL